MSAGIIIVGAGGHARVVADALRQSGARVLGFTDSDVRCHGLLVDGDRVLGGDDVLEAHAKAQVCLANGLGSVGVPRARRALQERLTGSGWRFIEVIHPRAIVSPSAQLGAGVQLMASAVVQAGAVLGEGCIVNTGAIIDHDCVLGAFCHVAPGAVLSGGAHLGECSHVGVGATIIQGIHVGANTVIGAGAVVVRDHLGGATLIGVPARVKAES